MSLADSSSLSAPNIPGGQWYYKIEVAPGVFTNGKPHGNLAICREYFNNIDMAGLRCLDIGTQEFVAPILFSRAGASQVVCYDRLRKEDRLNFLKTIYDFDTQCVSGIDMAGLKSALVARDIDPVFDIVNFSGVLYHMVDPLSGIAMARSFLREGGIMILETATSYRPGLHLELNAKGDRYGDGSNYFLPTISALDYFVRMLRLEAIDFGCTPGADHGRSVTILRATSTVLPEEDDAWMSRPWVEKDFQPFGLDYRELASRAAPVPYTSATAVARRAGGTPDLFAAFESLPRRRPDMALAELRLLDGLATC